jgi:hypothetical protein
VASGKQATATTKTKKTSARPKAQNQMPQTFAKGAKRYRRHRAKGVRE